MIGLASSGRQAEALAVYEQVRYRLDEELGMRPGPALRAAHAKILASGDRHSRPAGGPAARGPGAWFRGAWGPAAFFPPPGRPGGLHRPRGAARPPSRHGHAAPDRGAGRGAVRTAWCR